MEENSGGSQDPTSVVAQPMMMMCQIKTLAYQGRILITSYHNTKWIQFIEVSQFYCGRGCYAMNAKDAVI
jgi:hypothetical protein